ncbi:hypothetical protein EV196_108208 [Mariniflexile fucanivorans]|uniref:Thrombospondin type 3 repeat-containing protein n=1 Tax=Mariniflexile fucanivorans TaxID=264023 RepID=A0A4R1RDR9_9FLAO|nr:hypothetical protein [Mariniflexile fucanivorans]TCL64011.1 hypothetical protein EV196_108208 [Mariniflexile fucanivorans]
MRKLFFILFSISVLSFYTCDDGDVITVDFEFDETFEACGTDGLVFYKTKDDPSESLSIIIKELDSIGDLLVVGDDNTYEVDFSLSSTNVFNYRTYSNASLPTSGLFCSDVPLSSVKITKDIESTSGNVHIKTVLTEDDNDGISAEIEGYTNDTDGDGILDYLDEDDDGDNVLTKNEKPDPDGDGDLSDAQDTDGDGTPDYLDTDDDDDGVLTIDEENQSIDQNPANDISLDGIADYLNPAVATKVPATAYRQHTIYQTYVVSLTVSNFDLEIISLDVFDFGILDDGELSTSRKETPDFN